MKGYVDRETNTREPRVVRVRGQGKTARLHLRIRPYQEILVPNVENGGIVNDPIPARFSFLAWGSKAGKTTSGILRSAALLWGTREKIYRWIAPYHRQSMIAERRLRRALPEKHFKWRASERMLIGPKGTILTFHSGDRPDTIPGEDVDGVILDEAARLKEDVFENSLSTILATNGWMIAISTPAGRNWFWRHCKMGMKGEGSHFFRHFPSYVNPIFNSPEGIKNLEETKASLPEFVFRQIVLAEFVAETSSVFPSLEPCATPHLPLNGPIPGEAYVIAVDIGQLVDYTVATVWDVRDASLVSWWRIRGMDYPEQQRNLAALSRFWNGAPVLVERNSPGLPVVQNLAAAGVKALRGPDRKIGFQMTGGTKPALVHSWSMALRNREPILPMREPLMRGGVGWRALYEEHENYEYTITKAGNWTFSAPGGENDHDDVVMSCLLGWWAISKNQIVPRLTRPGIRRPARPGDRIVIEPT